MIALATMRNARDIYGEDSLDHLIDEAIADKAFSGIACGVWVDGREKFMRFAGNAADPDFADSRDCGPITEATLFDSASLTKPLATTLLVLKAVEAGAIDLCENVGAYLPQANPKAAEIPIHTLLTHTSGMPAIPAIERRFSSPHLIERGAAIAELLAIQPEYGPGEHVCYSCTGYMLLGLILERISGTLLGQLYKREIAEPLYLPRATFAPGISSSGEPFPIVGTATTEFCAWRGKYMHGQVHDESAYCFGGHSGNAGLFASLEDVSLTASMILQEGNANGRQFLAARYLPGIMTSQTDHLEERRSYGFRLHDAETFEGPLWPASSFGHTGFTGTSLAISPERRMVSVILSNRVHYGRRETAQKIHDFRLAFHSLAYADFCR